MDSRLLHVLAWLWVGYALAMVSIFTYFSLNFL
jgi:hypothetical protein